MLSRRQFNAVVSGTAVLCAERHLALDRRRVAPLWPPMRGGVSLAGGEFGCDRPTFSNLAPGVCGRDYAYPSERTIAYFAARGLGLFRVPFRWERVQPRLGQPLDPEELKRLRQVVDWAADYGALVILDLHNYGRYQLSINGKPRPVVIDERIGGSIPVSRAQFADVWQRLGHEFADTSTVTGLGLMNEPHDMGNSDWKVISQVAVDAVRMANQRAYVLVAGNGWSNAHRFGDINGFRGWINDRADRVVYEAHCYFDVDGTGKYSRSYAAELHGDPELPTRGARRLRVFLEWCGRNQANGFLGEFGVPGTDAGWLGVLEGALRELSQTSTPACYWAAGEWWHGYPLSVQPRQDMREPAPQLALLQKYLGTPPKA